MCLSFYALFCLFFLFSQLHSPLCAFEKRKNNLKKFYKNFKDINSNNFYSGRAALKKRPPLWKPSDSYLL